MKPSLSHDLKKDQHEYKPDINKVSYQEFFCLFPFDIYMCSFFIHGIILRSSYG